MLVCWEFSVADPYHIVRIQDVKKLLRIRIQGNFDMDQDLDPDPGKNDTDPAPAKKITGKYQENL